jgi:starch phosphorylase
MESALDRRRARSGGERNGIGVPTAADSAAFANALLDNLCFLQAKLPQHASRNDWYMALAYTVRDCMLANYITTVESLTGPSSTS